MKTLMYSLIFWFELLYLILKFRDSWEQSRLDTQIMYYVLAVPFFDQAIPAVPTVQFIKF